MLVCVGNITLDEAISRTGEHTESVGGDALYAALAARLVGGRPRILAPLGDDAPPIVLHALRAAGTEPTLLPRRDQPTVRNIVRYDGSGGRDWQLVLGEDHFERMSVHPDDVSDEVLAAPGILLSAMALQPQLDLAAWLRPRTEAVIYFDPQEDYIAGHEAELRSAVAACDVFMPSEVEAVALAGTHLLAEACRLFLSHGPHTVVIKSAEAGCCIATRDRPEPVFLPANLITPVDSTGAGDAFCGAFAAEHLRTNDPLAAAVAGTSAARVAVSGNGIDALLSAVLETVR
jgi:sugar/nucleoside kinase (ribokinase family)